MINNSINKLHNEFFNITFVFINFNSGIANNIIYVNI